MDADTDLLDNQAMELRRLTTVEYHRMAEVGILKDERVELIEGQLVAMSPIGPRHALAVDALAEMFVLAAQGRAKVRVHNPVVLNGVTEPNPDIVLARIGWRGYPFAHPGPEDILLLVEVADSGLATDRWDKGRLYGRAAISEYWVVDLKRNVVHVHRTPLEGAYRDVTTLTPPATVEVAALPGISIEAASLFF